MITNIAMTIAATLAKNGIHDACIQSCVGASVLLDEIASKLGCPNTLRTGIYCKTIGTERYHSFHCWNVIHQIRYDVYSVHIGPAEYMVGFDSPFSKRLETDTEESRERNKALVQLYLDKGADVFWANMLTVDPKKFRVFDRLREIYVGRIRTPE